MLNKVDLGQLIILEEMKTRKKYESKLMKYRSIIRGQTVFRVPPVQLGGPTQSYPSLCITHPLVCAIQQQSVMGLFNGRR